MLLAENRICRKQLKSPETIGKTSRNKNSKTEQETNEKLDCSASNARRRCPSGTPGNARGSPTEHFQQKDIYRYVYILGGGVAGGEGGGIVFLNAPRQAQLLQRYELLIPTDTERSKLYHQSKPPSVSKHCVITRVRCSRPTRNLPARKQRVPVPATLTPSFVVFWTITWL